MKTYDRKQNLLPAFRQQIEHGGSFPVRLCIAPIRVNEEIGVDCNHGLVSFAKHVIAVRRRLDRRPIILVKLRRDTLTADEMPRCERLGPPRSISDLRTKQIQDDCFDRHGVANAVAISHLTQQVIG